mmetsp:Transcript_372/g.895  ORF Transcript_372/g.895 Transcript_372/m.895 type:complete len:208 (-) Transcript_372:1152-1775(-)
MPVSRHLPRGDHFQRVVGADLHADLAAGAVLRAHLDPEIVACKVAAGCFARIQGGWCRIHLLLGEQEGPDYSVGAGVGTVVALRALVHIHVRHGRGNGTLFVRCGAQWHDASHGEFAHWHAVALKPVHGLKHLFNESAMTFVLQILLQRRICQGGPAIRRHLHLHEALQCHVHTAQVPLHNLFSALAIRLHNLFLERAHGLFEWQHP